MVASLKVFRGETSMAFFFGKNQPHSPAVVGEEEEETRRRLLHSRSFITSLGCAEQEEHILHSLVSKEADPPLRLRRLRRFAPFRLRPKTSNNYKKAAEEWSPRFNEHKDSKVSLATIRADDPRTHLRLDSQRDVQGGWTEGAALEVMSQTEDQVEVLTTPSPLTPNSSRVQESVSPEHKANCSPPDTPDTALSTKASSSFSSSACASTPKTTTAGGGRSGLVQEYLFEVTEAHGIPILSTANAPPYPSFTSLLLLQSSDVASFRRPQTQLGMVRESCRRHLRVLYGKIIQAKEEGQEIDLYHRMDNSSDQKWLDDIDTAQEVVAAAIRSNDLEEAIKIASMIIAHHQSPRMRSLLVVLYLANDQPKQALDQNIKNIQSVSALNFDASPVEVTVAVFLLLEHGLVLLANQTLDEALTAWREAVHMSMGLDGYRSPTAALLLSYLGIGHFCSGGLQSGIRLLEESLEMQRQMLSISDDYSSLEDNLNLLANTMVNLSVICAENDDPDRAVALLDEALVLYDSISFDTDEAAILIRQKIENITASTPERDDAIPSSVDVPGDCRNYEVNLDELLRENSTQSVATLNTLRTVDVQLYEHLRMSSFFGSSDGLPNRSLSPKSIDPSAFVCDDLLMMGPLGEERWDNSERVQEMVLSWFDTTTYGKAGQGRESIPVVVDDENVFNANLYLKQIHVQTLKHLEKDEIEDAIELLESTLRSHREKYGKTHHLVGNALQNIGMVHLFADDYRKALEKFDEAFRIRRKILGPHHPDVFDSLTKGALVHFAIGDLWKAHDSFWAIYDRMKACGHPVVYNILNNIAVTTYELGDIVNAMQVFKGALEAQMYVLQQKSLSEECKRMVHAARASLLENMGFINFDCGFDKHALCCYNEARTILDEEGIENPRRLGCVEDSIEYLQQTNETASPACAPALDWMDSLLAENHLSTWCQV